LILFVQSTVGQVPQNINHLCLPGSCKSIELSLIRCFELGEFIKLYSA